MIRDLRGYLDYLSKSGMLGRVKGSSSPDLEISAITDRENREHRNSSRALLFEDVEGYDMPVATNLMGSLKVLNGLFADSQIAELISGFNHPRDISMVKGAKMLMDSRPRISGSIGRGYRKLGSLDELPILKVWPKDAGRFITLPLVMTEGRISGTKNVGVYRMQVYDGKTTGMHWQSQKGGAMHALEAKESGKVLNVSVAIGTDPYNLVSAVAPLPPEINEFAFAGVARRARTELTGCGDYPAVPSNSEIVINGYVDPTESREEGPFGDHTGYYSIVEPTYVFHVKEIYAKENPIYAASVVGFPWSEDCAAGQFLMDYLKPFVRLVNGNIVDIYLPPEGVFTNVCFISVKKRFPGDAKKAMFSILGLGQLSLTKIIVAFDDDVDIRDLGRAMWAMSTRTDPERDMQIIRGAPTDTLDHASSIPAYGSKILIDATKKSREEGYPRKWPDTIVPDDSILREAERRWKRIS